MRFPSALFGTLSIVGTYFLVREFLSEKGQVKKHADTIALLSAFFLAISPWHLQFSRAAFEVNLSLTFIIFGVYSFLRGLRENRFLSFSAVSFGLGIFSYHSSRIVVPLIIAALVITFFNDLLKIGKKLIPPIIILTLFFLSFLPLASSPEAQIRFRVTNFLIPAVLQENEVDYQQLSAQEIERSEKAGDAFWGRIFYNRRIAFINYPNTLRVLSGYISHFDPQFLFVRGDVPLHHAPGFGMLYVWDAPFLVLGIVLLLFNYQKYRTRFIVPLIVWFLVAPLPASVTRQVPHAVRTLLILPTIHIFVAVGFFAVVRFFAKRHLLLGIGVSLFAVCILLFNAGYYFHRYYIFTNYDMAEKWLYGRDQAVAYTESVKDAYDKIIVSPLVDQPHIFWLFYSAYDPKKYLAEGGTVSGGWAEDRNRFDKYEFHDLDYEDTKEGGSILFVGLPSEFPDDANVVKKINYPNGKPGIYIVSP